MTSLLILAATAMLVQASSSSSSSDHEDNACAVKGVKTSRAIGGLERPEKVVAIGNRIFVSDNTKGAVVVDAHTDTISPTCNFASVGYKAGLHQSNGFAIDREAPALYLADIYEGFVFRCNLETKLARVAFKHEHGVNDIAIDSHGRLWYTVSAHTNGAAAFFGAVAKPNSDGEVWVYEPATHVRRRVASGLVFANGIVLNEATSTLFVAESWANRISRFHVDVANATVIAGPFSHASIPSVDGLQIAHNGEIIAASVLTNRVYGVSQCAAATTRILFDFEDTSYGRAYETAVATGRDIVAALTPFPAFGHALSSAFLDENNKLWVGSFGDSIRVAHQ